MSTLKTSTSNNSRTIFDTNPLPPTVVQELRDNWMNYSLASVYELFLPPNSGQGKIMGFFIPNSVLNNLFTGNTPIAGSLLRFYMGVDLSEERGGIQPKICPIIQLILPGEDPKAYNRCFAVDWSGSLELPNRSDATFIPRPPIEGLVQLKSQETEEITTMTPIQPFRYKFPDQLAWD
ncbi:MAG: hypothetical protein AAFP19_15765, partial [Bacteroidota bacterium]